MVPVARLLDHERQQLPWTCGAAALCMVYRALGVPADQEEVWARLNDGDAASRRAVRTHRLATDALRQGLAALVVEAAEPWPVLEACTRHDLPVIVNHRLPGGRTTHFSVLAGLDAGEVTLNDPLAGPLQRFSRPEFQGLWLHSPTPSQSAGCFLIALARPGTADHACALCGVAVPPERTCPECGGAIPLQPALALGCSKAGCPARTWRRIWCPHCDAPMTDVTDLREDERMIPPEQMQKLAQAIEQYHGLLQTAQEAAPDAKVREQLTAFQTLVRNTHAQLQDGVKQFNSEMEAKVKKLKEQAEEAKKKAEEAAQKRQQALDQVTARKAPVKEVDSVLGEKLKSDLLEAFGNRDRTPPRPVAGAHPPEDAWREWPAT
jgi:hypothetical protein